MDGQLMLTQLTSLKVHQVSYVIPPRLLSGYKVQLYIVKCSSHSITVHEFAFILLEYMHVIYHLFSFL